MRNATSEVVRIGRGAALAVVFLLASCNAQMQVGSMRGESDAGDVAGPVDVSSDGGLPADTTRMTEAAPPDTASPADGPAPPEDATVADTIVGDVEQPDATRPDGPLCPSSARAPVLCVAADASAPLTPIEECPTASRTLLRQDHQSLSFLTADAQGIYWMGEDRGLRILRNGANTPEVLAFASPQSFAIDSEELFYAAEQDASHVEIRKIKRDGTGSKVVVPGAMAGTDIVLGSDLVYFKPDMHSLAAAPKAGLGLMQGIVAGRMIDNVITDSTHVYWMESSSDASNDTTLTIWRRPHHGTATQMVASGLTLRSFWEQGDDLIVLSQEKSIVAGQEVASFLEIPKAGGCARILVSLPKSRYPPRIAAVAIDGQGIYWIATEVDGAEFSIWYAPRSGGIAVKASVALHDENLALTPTQVFWVDRIPALTTYTSFIQVMDRP